MTKYIRRVSPLPCILLGLALAALACEPSARPPGPTFHEAANPETLADWGQLSVQGDRLVLAPGVMPYDLNTALFSDYALKLRTVWLPPDADPARYDAREPFAFPVGAVITKTFYYPRAGGESFERVARTRAPLAHFAGRTRHSLSLSKVRLIETRVLVHRAGGWEGLPYIWDDAQQSATLQRTGGFVELELVDETGAARALDYLVPSVNQCAGCHVTDKRAGGIRPIGTAARHLNRSFNDYDHADGSANQLEAWSNASLLVGAPAAVDAPRAPAWRGETALTGSALEAAARAYLDINCAHCHSRHGPADTSGLFLEPWEPAGPNLGICKPPIAAGRGTGGRRFSIVPGDAAASILVHRMASEEPDTMMPELGRATADREAVQLITNWINTLPGSCD